MANTVKPSFVCKQFLSIYYDKLIGNGYDELADYYTPEAQVGRRDIQEHRSRSITGAENIRAEMARQHDLFSKCIPKLDDVLFQQSIGGSIVLHVAGSYQDLANHVAYPFTQSFLLAPEEVAKPSGPPELLFSIANDLQLEFPKEKTPSPSVNGASSSAQDAQVPATEQNPVEKKSRDAVRLGKKAGAAVTEPPHANAPAPTPEPPSTATKPLPQPQDPKPASPTPEPEPTSWARAAGSAPPPQASSPAKPPAAAPKQTAPAPAKKAPQVHAAYPVFVRNLPYTISEEEIREAMAKVSGKIGKISMFDGAAIVNIDEPRMSLAELLSTYGSGGIIIRGRAATLAEKHQQSHQHQGRQNGSTPRGGRGGGGRGGRASRKGD